MTRDALVLFFAKALKNMCPTGYRGTMKVREAEVISVISKILTENFKTQTEANRNIELLVEG